MWSDVSVLHFVDIYVRLLQGIKVLSDYEHNVSRGIAGAQEAKHEHKT